LLYVADTANAPYGDRPASFIVERSHQLAEFLVAQDVDALVIACNTASVHAAKSIRAHFNLPVIAIEPAIKPAALTSKSKVIAVLATSQTIASENVAQLASMYRSQAKILLQACPGLVEHIEAGDLNSKALHAKLFAYLAPLIDQGVDTIVLGCTHYPILTPLFRELVGATIQLVDPAPAVARELVRRLTLASKILATPTSQEAEQGKQSFYSSAASMSLQGIIANILQQEIALQVLPI
jgi:glutamate racemase